MRPFIDMEQHSPEWFLARKNRITGSAVGSILGLSPWQKPHEVMRRMVREYLDQPSEFSGNPATEYGTLNEPNALADYQMETGQLVDPVGFILHDDWLGASPDGLIGEDGLIEIKCPFGLRNAPTPQFKTAKEQEHYYAQMQIQMLCTGRKWCDFYQWSAYGSKLEHVELDPIWIEDNVPRLRAFYEHYLQEREPENNWKYIDGGELVHTYKSKLAAFEVAKVELEEAKDALILASNGESCQFGDVKVTLCERKGSVSYAKAIKELAPDADLEKYRGKDSEYWRVG